jgi:hypothetical protein
MLNPSYDEYSPRPPRPPRHSKQQPHHYHHHRHRQPYHDHQQYSINPLPSPNEWISNHTTSTTDSMKSYGFNSIDGGRPTEQFIPSYFSKLPRAITRKKEIRIPTPLITIRCQQEIFKKKVKSRIFQFQYDKINMINMVMETLDELKKKRLKKIEKNKKILNNVQLLSLNHPHPIIKRFMSSIRILLSKSEVNRETILFQLLALHSQKDLENSRLRKVLMKMLNVVDLSLEHLDFAIEMKYGNSKNSRSNKNKRKNRKNNGKNDKVEMLNVIRGTYNTRSGMNGKNMPVLTVRSPRLPSMKGLKSKHTGVLISSYL